MGRRGTRFDEVLFEVEARCLADGLTEREARDPEKVAEIARNMGLVNLAGLVKLPKYHKKFLGIYYHMKRMRQ